MKKFEKFEEVYNYRKSLSNTGWLYIKYDDFQDLENAEYYTFEKGEITPDDMIETDDDVVPRVLYEIDKTITGLVENHIFQAIYENMEETGKDFTLEEKIEALYHYVEEDTFMY
ncbi:DUF7716 domain-containing protein [Cellulophaga lytica]|uniref:DUF7716 domain-containing protein n=1 Tax=Cellulophaga lytica TaxID=979 RepID=UPI000B5C91EE|nr:hypothetical protein [Cellulophaga lytica]MDO6855340.1 hypothetical protein [Cellulophaga lytica]SNQ44784.1 hypothetical protein CL8139_630002 [Cellulophaga lytica]